MDVEFAHTRKGLESSEEVLSNVHCQANRGKMDSHSLFTTHARRCGYDILVDIADIRSCTLYDGPGRTTESEYIKQNLKVITTRAGRLRSRLPEIESEL